MNIVFTFANGDKARSYVVPDSIQGIAEMQSALEMSRRWKITEVELDVDHCVLCSFAEATDGIFCDECREQLEALPEIPTAVGVVASATKLEGA